MMIVSPSRTLTFVIALRVEMTGFRAPPGPGVSSVICESCALMSIFTYSRPTRVGRISSVIPVFWNFVVTMVWLPRISADCTGNSTPVLITAVSPWTAMIDGWERISAEPRSWRARSM